MATLEELREQYYGDLMKSGQDLIRDLPPLPKETVEGISGAEQQALDTARQSVAQRPDYLSMGVGSLGQASLTAADAAAQAKGTTGQFDPASTQAFMNPYQQQVIDEYTKEMQRQFDISRQGRAAQAIGAGAFGGGREGVLEAEAMTGFQRQLGQGLAGLMSSGYQQAQNAAMQAFENQQRRGQLAAQNLGNIGRLQTGIGQMFGQFAPISSGVTERDVSTLARIGATERGIGQAERTADYQNLLRQYQQPFQALQFQSGILGGFPTYDQSSTAQIFNPLLTGIQSLF
tara:strand:+ start:851 stop:1714 length:864 start_codon:yes stop_codon:yes gene_type:complete